MGEREPKLCLEFQNNYAHGRKAIMEQALEKALQWQTSIENETEVVNGRTYVGPHKWIVCLVGSEAYSVKQFMSIHDRELKRNQNLSISIMGLSSDPLSPMVVQDYKSLTRLTYEGNYVNLVDVDKADILASQFL